MSKLPKVMIGIATYEGKDYMWKDFLKNIRNLTYPNVDIVVIDNSPTKKYYSNLKRQLNRSNERVFHVNRGDTSREAQAKSLNKLREVFLKGDYDYFMSLESDTVSPIDVIERFILHNKSVVGAMYLIGHDWSKTQPPRPCLFSTRKGKDGKGQTFNIPPEDGWKFFGHGVVKVHGCGIGCTLIKRFVLEKFKFWYFLEGVPKHADVLLYMDLHNNGVQVFVDTDLYVQHFRSNWDDVKDI